MNTLAIIIVSFSIGAAVGFITIAMFAINPRED
jgi:hypothetical protein